jgi:hypothetical protein
VSLLLAWQSLTLSSDVHVEEDVARAIKVYDCGDITIRCLHAVVHCGTTDLVADVVRVFLFLSTV